MKARGLIVSVVIAVILLAYGFSGGASNHSTTIPGKYTSKVGVLVLHDNGTFDLTQQGVKYKGNYVASASGSIQMITYKGATSTGEWKGDYIIDSEGIRWDKK